MPANTKTRSGEAAILTVAVENVFRKLIRFLVGKISLVRLQEMLRYIYVEEAERNLRADNPGKNVPMTKLALATGLDTRTLFQVRKRLESGDDQYRQKFLSELTPESAIIEAWVEREGEPESGQRRKLKYGSEASEFERLVRATISGRGITIQSIIERLVATRSIEHDRENQTVELLVDKFSPYLSDDEPSMVNAALTSISSLISTVEHNLAAPQPDRLFQRQFWTFRLSPEDREDFRKAMRERLEKYKLETETAMESWEVQDYSEGLATAGVGFYYFEEA